eukprot:tig00000361_g24405.t1
MPEDVHVSEPVREHAQRSGEETLADTAAGTVFAASSSDGSATRKRRRTDDSAHPDTETVAEGDAGAAAGDAEDAAAPASIQQPAASQPSIQQLPDDILTYIFKRLDLPAAAVARAVCRRWRVEAEAILWRRLDIKLSPERADRLAGFLIGAQGLDWSELDVAERASLIWQSLAPGRWIRMAPDASLSLEVEPATEDYRSEAWRSTLSLLTAFSAAAGAAGGAGGLGEVDVECSCASDTCLADILDALAPPGAAVCPSLRSLALRGKSSGDPDCTVLCLGLDPVLRPLVFPNLSSLACNILCCYPGRHDSEALARSLPNLKRLEVEYDDERTGVVVEHSVEKAAIGLAAGVFPALESFKAVETGGCERAGPLVEALASSNAALTLRELVLQWSSGLAELPVEALRALGRFTALERLRGPFAVFPEAAGDDLAALGSLPALKSLGPVDLYEDDEALAARLDCLAAALARSSSLTELELSIGAGLTPEALAALARLARAGRGRLSLELDAELAPGRPAEVAAALAGAPPRRLVLFVYMKEEAADESGRVSCERLDGLSAFAGCSAGDIEVRLCVEGEGECEGMDAAREAVSRALPSARVVVQRVSFTRVA